MWELKLFQLHSGNVTELPVRMVTIEKNLQKILEDNLFDLIGVHFPASEHSTGPTDAHVHVPMRGDYTLVTENLERPSSDLKALYEDVENYLFFIGDDVQKKILKYYIAFKRIRNFVCIEVRPQVKSLVCIRVDISLVSIDGQFARDITESSSLGLTASSFVSDRWRIWSVPNPASS